MLMRVWVFLLSFYLVFGQIYQAHALLPAAVATARGVGVLVKAGVVAHGAGALARASYNWCKANKLKCAGLIGGTADLILGDDDDGDYPVKCLYRWSHVETDSPKSRMQAYNDLISSLSLSQPQKEFRHANTYNDGMALIEKDHHDNYVKTNRATSTNGKWLPFGGYHFSYFVKYKYHMDYSVDTGSILFYVKCHSKDDDDYKVETEAEQRKREKELWDKLKDKLYDHDITNIVNNYGDDIDIDKYCASGATCYFIEAEFEKEINNNDYDIDKVTNDNCNVRNGKIYSCPNAKKKKDRYDDDDMDVPKKDKDDEKPKKDKDDDDGQTNSDDDDGTKIPSIPSFAIPAFCVWAKHVCDFTDWVKEPPKIDDNDDYKPEITDLSGKFNKIDNSYYNASGTCPAPVPVNLTYGTVYISYQNYCDFAVKISPLVIALAYILGAYIVVRGK